jgi:hypothetical protein
MLPDWDRCLLQHVEILDPAALIAYFLTEDILYVVSDGGADADRGSYGALLASADAIFAKISGSTEGSLPGSFRAESYGCLAIVRLVYHFHPYYNLDPILCCNSFYCDNKGLITRLHFAAGALSPFPRHFLRSDMDVEMQILDTISLLGITFNYNHVQGHQDTTPTLPSLTAPLTRQADLNIECDNLATAALKLACPSPTVTFLPAGKVVVTIDGTTINRKLPRAMRNLIGRRLKLSSFSRRYGWSADQFNQIDWPQYVWPLLNFLSRNVCLIINHFLFYVAPGTPIKVIPWRPRVATPSGRRGQHEILILVKELVRSRWTKMAKQPRGVKRPRKSTAKIRAKISDHGEVRRATG